MSPTEVTASFVAVKDFSRLAIVLVKDERSSVMDGRFRNRTIIIVIVALIAGGLSQVPLVRGASLPKPTYTNKARFRIPFRFDTTALQRMNAREIQLHVSQNHGETWDLSQTLTPDGGKFDFQSPGEGEFWFSVKTLDGRNQLHPPRGSYETGLIVVVDSTSPTLDISAKQGAPGQVQLNWKATDANLDLTSLRFEYQAQNSTDWEILSIIPKATGEHSWSVFHSGIVAVRGTVSDLAGNVGNSSAQVNLVAAGGQIEKPRPAKRVPIAMPDEPPVSSDNDSRISQAPVEAEPEENDDNRMPIITPRGAIPRYAPSQRLVSNKRPVPVDEQPTQTLTSQQPDSDIAIETPTLKSAPVSPSLPEVTERQPLPERQPVMTAPQGHALQTSQQPRRSTNGRQRVVRTRRFQIGYELNDIGPSGVGGVELFITEDNGRVWWKYGDDPDQKSPFDVEVREDGTYGFAIRARSGAGLSTDAPVPGEPPAIVVAVDQTEPIVELLPVQQGQGVNVNRLLIRWKVTEEHPSDRPISLYYAATLNGPWEPISGWREDPNGSFEWTAGPGVPSQFYIRVMARDSAGNVGKSETRTPVVVDLQRPSARIVDVDVAPGGGPQ